jgi:ferric-dicitrate binding protein FerR (iron transport regulator)
MKFEKHVLISKLIACFFFKGLSDNEREEFDSWLKEDSSNKDILDNISNQEIWEVREENINKLDKKLIWKNIYEKIKPVEQKSIPLYKKVLKYVAAIIIPLALTYGGWNLYNEIQNDLDKNLAQIKPGKSKAYLKLSSGQIIELGKKDTILNTKNKNVKIKINSGKIEYKKKNKNKLNKEIHIIKIPKGGEYFLILSDGTKVWVNSETEIKFPSVFTGKKRRVCLKGEALFEVTKDNNRPFIVHANGMNVKVLGTKFNISAYPDDDFVHTTLVEGKVFVNERISGLQQSAILKPSQQAFLSKSGNNELIVQEVNTDMYTSWAEGKFIFKEETLENIFKKLSRWYNIEVFYDDVDAKYAEFSGIFPRFDNCETILKLMKKTNSVKFEVTETTVLVTSIK